MSIALLATDTTVICRVVKALYDAAPGYTYLSNFLSYKSANGLDATVNALASAYSSQTNAELAVTVCTNLGLTGTAYTAGVDYMTSQFNATTAANRGVVIKDAMNGLANLTGDATFGAAADAFNSSIATSEAYSTNSANTVTDLETLMNADDAVATTIFNLTTDVETTTGTGGNDDFSGSTTGTGATLNTGDVINGGAGSDTLTITAVTNDATFQTNGVETINVRMVSVQSFDAIGWSGVNTVRITEDSIGTATQDLTISNADVDTTFAVASLNDLTVGYLAAASGDVGLVALEGVVGATTTQSNLIRVNGVSGMEIAMSNTNRSDVDGDALKTISISGDGSGALTVYDVTSVDMSDFAGNMKLTFTAASDVSITGGQGNDVLNLATYLNSDDSIDGGSGTDTLQFTLVNSVNLRNVTGVETLAITGRASATGTVNLSGVSDVGVVNVALNGSASVSLVDLVDSGVVNVSGVAAVTTGFLDVRYEDTATQGYLNVTPTGAGTFTRIGVSGVALTSIDVTGGASGNQNVTVSQLRTQNTVDNISISGLTKASGSGSFTISSLVSSAAQNISVVANSSADVSVAVTGVSAANTLTIAANGAVAALTGSVYGATADTHTYTISASDGGEADGFNATVAGAGAIGISVDVGAGSKASALSVTSAGTATLSVNVVAAASGVVSIDGLQMSETIGNVDGVTITVGASGGVLIDSIGASGVGDISMSIAGSGGTATITSITAGEIADITVSGTVSGAATLTAIYTSAVGDISVDTGVVFTAAINGSTAVAGQALTVGDIDLAGDNASITFDQHSALTVGSITLSGSGALVDNNGGGTATFGDITVGGSASMNVILGVVESIDSYNSVGKVAGTAILTFSAAVDAISNITLGTGQNIVNIGAAGADITMQDGTGVDQLIFHNSASVVVDVATIEGFDFTTSTDVIGIDVSDVKIGLASAAGNVVAAGSAFDVVKFGTAAGTTFTVAEGTDAIVFTSATFTNLADFKNNVSAYGLAGTAGVLSSILALWSDGDNTHLSIITTSAAVAGGGSLAVNGAAAGTATNVVDLAVFSNIDITTGTYTALSFGDKFIGY